MRTRIFQRGDWHEVISWEPIETAPRNGSDILLTDGEQLCVAAYDQDTMPGQWLVQLWLGDMGTDFNREKIRQAALFEPKYWQPTPELPTNGS